MLVLDYGRLGAYIIGSKKRIDALNKKKEPRLRAVQREVEGISWDRGLRVGES